MIKLDNKSYFNFSGGEVHCKIPYVGGGQNNLLDVLVTDYSMNGMMALAEYAEIAYRHKNKIHAIIPYFPYARQDRVMEADEPYSLRVFCKFLNAMGLAKVTILDPHSDVTTALVHDVNVIPQWDIVRESLAPYVFANPDIIFISPDAGAYKKVQKVMPVDSRIAIGTKERDATGNIVATNLYSPVDLKDKRCIIIDDICDGGKTFTELAKLLKAKGAAVVNLYVTHGIFSKGTQVLFDNGIDMIYTTDSFKHEPDSRIKVKSIEELLK